MPFQLLERLGVVRLAFEQMLDDGASTMPVASPSVCPLKWPLQATTSNCSPVAGSTADVGAGHPEPCDHARFLGMPGMEQAQLAAVEGFRLMRPAKAVEQMPLAWVADRGSAHDMIEVALLGRSIAPPR
jgi:hypothetical protein